MSFGFSYFVLKYRSFIPDSCVPELKNFADTFSYVSQTMSETNTNNRIIIKIELLVNLIMIRVATHFPR
jgi:hypothetical protein